MCNCLCSKLHPAEQGVCTGAKDRLVDIVDPAGNKVGDMLVCNACYKAASGVARYQ